MQGNTSAHSYLHFINLVTFFCTMLRSYGYVENIVEIHHRCLTLMSKATIKLAKPKLMITVITVFRSIRSREENN